MEGKYRDGFYPTRRIELLLGVKRAFEVEALGLSGDGREVEGDIEGANGAGPRFETMGSHNDLVFAWALALFGMGRRWLQWRVAVWNRMS